MTIRVTFEIFHQREDIYDDHTISDSSSYYIFGAVHTSPIVVIVGVVGLLVSIILGVIAHIVFSYITQVFVSTLAKMTTRPGVTGCGPGVLLLGAAAVAAADSSASATATHL